MSTHYTCGSGRNVRGNCGHKHRTIEAAERCLEQDARDCKRVGGYSDRALRKIVDGEDVDLDETEVSWLNRYR